MTTYLMYGLISYLVWVVCLLIASRAGVIDDYFAEVTRDHGATMAGCGIALVGVMSIFVWPIFWVFIIVSIWRRLND